MAYLTESYMPYTLIRLLDVEDAAALNLERCTEEHHGYEPDIPLYHPGRVQMAVIDAYFAAEGPEDDYNT